MVAVVRIVGRFVVSGDGAAVVELGITAPVVVICPVTVVYILVVVRIVVVKWGDVVMRADVVVCGEPELSRFVVVVVRGVRDVVREGAVTSVPEAVVRTVVTAEP